MSGVKCISKKLLPALFFFALLTGCGSKYELPYTADSPISSFRIADIEGESVTGQTFAENLCVVDGDINASGLSLTPGTAAGLFDVNGKNTIYAKNIHERLNPASLTKVMTAIVALKHGSGDMLLTAGPNVKITESGAQLLGIKEGDVMTLDQALHVLLIYSANDAAVMIAEGIAGSEEEFVKLMNEEALSIGATNTHFVNSHGLTADEHYTTAYDMYLIMNDAADFSLFNEIIHMNEYKSIYHDKAGEEKEIDIKSTNKYITGDKSAPSGLTVIGGKTGTTNAAGHCLVLMSRDTRSDPYISVVMNSGSGDDLYSYMTELLALYDD